MKQKCRPLGGGAPFLEQIINSDTADPKAEQVESLRLAVRQSPSVAAPAARSLQRLVPNVAYALLEETDPHLRLLT
jgi:hypothetical protein